MLKILHYDNIFKFLRKSDEEESNSTAFGKYVSDLKKFKWNF